MRLVGVAHAGGQEVVARHHPQAGQVVVDPHRIAAESDEELLHQRLRPLTVGEGRLQRAGALDEFLDRNLVLGLLRVVGREGLTDHGAGVLAQAQQGRQGVVD